MRTLKVLAVFLAAGILVLSLAGCPPRRADLVVTEFVATGEPEVVTNGSETSVEVPVSVTVENQGNADADIFKVAVLYTSGAQEFVVAFSVEGESSLWYPFTDEALEPGASVTFNGTLIFADGGETVVARAEADSINGDEFIPDFGRVRESDEDNNLSEPLTIVLP
jgi:hypothetical protein